MSLYDYEQTLVLAKTESTEGTDSSPAIADMVLATGAVQWTALQASYEDLNLVDGRQGSKSQIVGSPHGTVNLAVQLTAGGDAADLDKLPQWNALMLACGFSATLTADTQVDYAPVSGDYSSITIHGNIDRVDGKLLGARGNAVIDGSAGQVPKINFSMMGARSAVADAAPASGTLPSFPDGLPVSADNTTVSIGGTSVCVSEFSIDCGRTPVFDDIAGCRAVRINRRSMTGRLTVDLPDVDTLNLIELAAAATTQAVVITHGTAAGSIVVLTMPVVQLKPGQFSERNGVLSLPIDLQIIPSGADDDLTITTK